MATEGNRDYLTLPFKMMIALKSIYITLKLTVITILKIIF